VNQELARSPRRDIGSPARESVEAEQRELIRQRVDPSASEAEFDLFLEIAARYQLNPLVGELYLTKMPGRTGQPPTFTPVVGRAGYVAIAQRQPTYRGLRSGVVRQMDEFEFVWGEAGPDGTEPRVYHRVARRRGEWTPPEPPEGFEGDRNVWERAKAEENLRDEWERGKIVGGWAKVYREGSEPTFFFATWGEYAPRDVQRNKAWRDYPQEMIRKCAVSNAVREAFSLSGLYDEAEMARAVDSGELPGSVQEEPDWGEDPALAARLQGLVDEVNRHRPGTFRRAKVRQVLSGASEEDRRAFAAELERELREGGHAVPEPPRADVPGQSEPGEGIEDAVVVEDGQAPEGEPGASAA
jgi:hypothetical protein